MTCRCFPRRRKSLNIDNASVRMNSPCSVLGTWAGFLPVCCSGHCGECVAVWWMPGWKVVFHSALSSLPLSGSFGTCVPTASCWKGPKGKTTVVKGTEAGHGQEKHCLRRTGLDPGRRALSPGEGHTRDKSSLPTTTSWDIEKQLPKSEGTLPPLCILVPFDPHRSSEHQLQYNFK